MRRHARCGHPSFHFIHRETDEEVARGQLKVEPEVHQMGLRCTCWWMAAVLQQAVEIVKTDLPCAQYIMQKLELLANM